MTTSEGIRDVSADKSFSVADCWAKSDNIWVETAWTVLEAANASATMSRSKHVKMLSMPIRAATYLRSRT
jgi:hypothetical protein